MIEQQRISGATEAWRRRRAVEPHPAGWIGRAIAAALGVGPSAVSNWLRKVRAGGVDALRSQRHQTGKRVAALIKREFGVTYHPEYIPRLLRALGWPSQQPGSKASQRDEQKIEQFQADWDAVK